jgi:hypothetical protein
MFWEVIYKGYSWALKSFLNHPAFAVSMETPEGENFLRKSRVKMSGRHGLQELVSAEVMKHIPKTVGSIAASISYQYAGNKDGLHHSGHCASEIKFYVGDDIKGYSGRTYVYVAGYPGPEFEMNGHKEVVQKAKTLLKDPGFLSFILGQYAANPVSSLEN